MRDKMSLMDYYNNYYFGYADLPDLEPFGTGLDFLGAQTNNMKSKKLIKLLDTSGKDEILQFCYGFRLYREYLC
jgi:hypothetical protein